MNLQSYRSSLRGVETSLTDIIHGVFVYLLILISRRKRKKVDACAYSFVGKSGSLQSLQKSL